MMRTLAVVGAGSWGTALAVACSGRAERVHLWAREEEVARRVNQTRHNPLYLPDCPLPANITAYTDFEDCLEGAELVLLAPPSHAMRRIVLYALPWLQPQQLLVSATKGLEENTHLRMTQVIRETLQQAFVPRLAVLSGPSFAREVAQGEPAALVVASSDEAVATAVQSRLSGGNFRLYTNADEVGVELGASVKNVIAIAAGVCAGLGLGSNTMAALITRGLAEITRLAIAHGAKPSTLAGLSGLGDLVLTCNGSLSRNRTLGLELARGRKLDEILGGMSMVAEGVKTTFAALDLAAEKGVEMPITQQMSHLLAGRKTASEALRELMERSLKPE
jgi:glycerol-3-phosphate dehydrogenase (NAD(P)+)